MEFTAPDAAKIKSILSSKSQGSELKSLLVPIDFSQCAFNALSQALILSAYTGAEIILAHAIHIPMKTASLHVSSIDELEREAREKLRDLESRVEAWTETHGMEKIKISSVLAVGFPAEEIIRIADETDVCMVVMGTQGAGGVEGFLLGSNASTVINRAECPVLAMPSGKLLYELKKIGFATDLKVIDEDSLAEITAFAKPYDALIEFVHLFTPGEIVANDQLTAFEKKVREICDYPKLNFEGFETFYENVSEALEQYVQGNQVDVLAVLKRERGFFEGLFHSSVTKKVTISAQEPVLVLHE